METIHRSRTPSGLVKKGKYVRALMDVLAEHGSQTTQTLMHVYNRHGELGYSRDYIQTNLDKLVASGELRLDPEDQSYHLGGNVAKVKAVGQGIAAAIIERHGANPFGDLDLRTPVEKLVHPQEQEIKSVPKFTINIPDKIEGKLSRLPSLELVLGLAWLQEMPEIEAVVTYYCATHKAQYSVSPKGIIEFSDE